MEIKAIDRIKYMIKWVTTMGIIWVTRGAFIFTVWVGTILFLVPAVSSEILIVPDDYATIQEAIDAAGFEDTIRILPGVYSETLAFKDGVLLMGESMDLVTVRPEGKPASVISARNCQQGLIFGLTLEYPNPDTSGNKITGILIENSSIEVINCRIRHMSGTGIVIRGESTPLIGECIIESNGFCGIHATGKGARPEIKNSQCLNNGQQRILFDNGAKAVV